MAGSPAEAWSWEIAADPAEVHDLLCASDAHQAEVYKMAAPVRRMETTRKRVGTGSVHLLRNGAEAAAMFTLTWTPPFEQDLAVFPPARKPAYLERLAVRPQYLEGGAIVGAQCIRKAIEVAQEVGGDALRAEANPDLTRTRTLLGLLGFLQCGPAQPGALRRVYLQRALQPPAR